MENAIKAAQTYGHIPVTGKLDEATITLMNSPRCGKYIAEKSTGTNMKEIRNYVIM